MQILEYTSLPETVDKKWEVTMLYNLLTLHWPFWNIQLKTRIVFKKDKATQHVILKNEETVNYFN